MHKIKELMLKYKEQILYIFFGGCTTLLNWGVYYVCTRVFSWDELVSNGIAWAAGVLFAYFTNKLFVFESKSFAPKVFWREFSEFVLARVFSLLLDEGFMAVTVKAFGLPDLPMKLVSNIIVIIVNYIFSKLIIFKKPKDTSEESHE